MPLVTWINSQPDPFFTGSVCFGFTADQVRMERELRPDRQYKNDCCEKAGDYKQSTINLWNITGQIRQVASKSMATEPSYNHERIKLIFRTILQKYPAQSWISLIKREEHTTPLGDSGKGFTLHSMEPCSLVFSSRLTFFTTLNVKGKQSFPCTEMQTCC